jgi:hypothetical protein
MPLETPVLFVIYRRPDQTARVFAAIAAARPRRLLVAADGPAAGEESLCMRTRAVVDRVDWPCELSVDFSPGNLGLSARMTSALDWAFRSCDRAIVLEDDCLPAGRFFGFCDELLSRYADDARVLHVSGECYQPRRRSDRSYSFSKYPLAWGWATWRRAWKLFDPELATWPAVRRSPEHGALFDSVDELRYWSGVFDGMHERRLLAWDYAWYYACMTQGLSIHPAVNLVSNIGYGDGATHTVAHSPLADRPAEALEEPLRHPEWVVRDREADGVTFDVRFPGALLRRERSVAYQLSRPFRAAWRRLRP